jgi:branched-chain amino acid transport system substrate-binding protein
VRRAVAALTLVGALAQALGCGGSDDPLRLAVQVDCQGAFASWADPELSGAYLPLLQRGARLVGPELQSGVKSARIAGRPLAVRVACTESMESTNAVPQLRELLEDWRPDVVVGSGIGSQDGFIVRDLAQRYPDVTFLVTIPSAQQITLSHSVPNVFRFTRDNPQSTAGLGSYAYHVLGWRRAAVVTGDSPDDWEETAGFDAEFCALGGTVTRDDGRAWAPAGATAAATRYADTADGVAVLSAFVPPTAFLQALARTPEGVAGRLVLGGWAFEDPANLRVPKGSLEGAVVASHLPLGGGGGPAWDAYLKAYDSSYPGLPPGTAAGSLAVLYRNAVEAVAEALTETGGDSGQSGKRLRGALSRLTAGTLPRPTRLDENRQAVSSVFLSRVGKNRGKVPTLRTVRVVNGVEQTFGGIFRPEGGAITATTDACRRDAAPPPWAS